MLDKSKIIKILNDLNLPVGEYWLIAGTAMVKHGVKEETKDIDIGCTTKLFEKLAERGYEVDNISYERRSLTIGSDIEVFENWFVDKIDLLDGIPVTSLESLIKLKKEIGRAKDFEDISLINKFMARNVSVKS